MPEVPLHAASSWTASSQFSTTHWSVALEAGASQESSAQAALEGFAVVEAVTGWTNLHSSVTANAVVFNLGNHFMGHAARHQWASRTHVTLPGTDVLALV